MGTSSISTLGRRESRTAVLWWKHQQSQPSGRGEGEQPYSDWIFVNLDPRVEGKANRGVLIETSSMSTLGQKERRTAVYRLKHHQSRPSGGGIGGQGYSHWNIIHLNPRAEERANSGILIETSSISTLGRRERRADCSTFNLDPGSAGKANSHILIDPSSILTLGRDESQTAVFRLKHRQSI